MLQQDKPEDFCVGTGESNSVRDFLETGFEYVGIEIDWQGEGPDEKGIIKSVDKKWEGNLTPGQTIIEINPRYFRPTEVDYLKADITKAKKILNWQPRIMFRDLVMIMLDHDMMQNGLEPLKEGIRSVREKGLKWTDHFSVDFKEIANEI